MLNNKSTPSNVKSYYAFCTFLSLHQLIKVKTRMTRNRATIINHVLASYPERVSLKGIIDVELPDNQLIFCTRKSFKIERGTHRHVKFRLFKHYLADLFEETLNFQFS